MSVYKKLAEARVKLQGTEIKKSGHNKYAGYSYFELADFLPVVNTIFDQVGLCDVIRFTPEAATITIYDVDDASNTIEFVSPIAEAPLKGALPIQALGAQHTYLRRYLYMLALNITEHDAIDSSEPVKPRPKDEVIAELEKVAKKGSDALRKAYLKLINEERVLVADDAPRLKELAANVDSKEKSNG